MDLQAEEVSFFADFVDAIGGIDRATRHIAGVLEANERCLGVVVDFGTNRGMDLLPGHDAIVAGTDDARHTAGDGGHGGKLIETDVAALFTDHFVAVVGPEFDRDEVAHATRRNEESSLFVKDFSGTLLELIDRGVFAVNVVAHFRSSHGAAHFVAWTCDSVAAKVDDALDGR